MSQPEISEGLVSELESWMQEQFGLSIHEEAVERNDWSLIVRLHAMIETCLNGAILKELKAPSLSTIISKLDTSNSQTGKIAFAMALGIISDNESAFIKKLSELRNICVHDIRNFNFDLNDHLAKIGKERKKSLLDSCYRLANPKPTSLSPRSLLLLGVMIVMRGLMIHDLRCEGRQLKNRVAQLKGELFDAEHQSTPKE